MATTLQFIDSNGNQTDAVELDAALVEREKGEQAVHDSVVAFHARHRAGTACTKNRSMVRGGGHKPYRQKGTGRARAGSRRSPIWRGGGIVFGPTPRSFAKRINRKVERLALRRAFTERLDEGAVIGVDAFELGEPKTRAMVDFLTGVGAGEDVLVLVDSIDKNLELASRNLPNVKVIKALSANAYWMLLFQKIVITKAALEMLGTRVGPKEKAQ